MLGSRGAHCCGVLGGREICIGSKSSGKGLEEERPPRVKHKGGLTQPALDQQIAGSWQSIWEGRSSAACLLCSSALPQAMALAAARQHFVPLICRVEESWRREYGGSVVSRIRGASKLHGGEERQMSKGMELFMQDLGGKHADRASRGAMSEW